MKRILLGGFLLLLGCVSQAQTFAEWFKQNKTQIKYDLQQIAALEIYAKDVVKGYQVVQDGLNVINDLKHGDFDLHHDYFASLSTVNGSVKNNDAVADSHNLLALILQQCQRTTAQVTSGAVFSGTETGYINNVLSSLLDGCNKDAAELVSLTTDGTYSLQDHERLARIQAVHARVSDKYNFARHFGAQVSLLTLQRKKEQNDVEALKNSYDIQ